MQKEGPPVICQKREGPLPMEAIPGERELSFKEGPLKTFFNERGYFYFFGHALPHPGT